MNLYQVEDPETQQITSLYGSTANKRCLKIWDYGRFAHKTLLLTGTAFVNVLYDIENLISIVDQREPVLPDTYNNIVDKVENIKDYFDYKISYFKSDDKDGFFPERRDKFTPIQMSEKQEEQYNHIKNTGIPHNKSSENPNAFYIAERYASNMIGNNKKENTTSNPKIEKIIELIKQNPNQKFIIYCGLTEYGLNSIHQALIKHNLEPVRISGRENSTQKEESKFYFNFYNFKNNNFFNVDNIPINYVKFINNKHNILLISKAGAEGVDTVNCQNIILYESQWNDALSEQIIARAIRFKSHIGLPQKERYVNVYRLIYCFKSDMKLAEQILNDEENINYNELKAQIKGDVQEQMIDIAISNGSFVPKKYEVEELSFRNEKNEVIKYVSDKEWNEYKTFKLPNQRQKFLKDKFYKWFEKYGSLKNRENGVVLPTVEELKKLTYKNHEGKTIKFIPDISIYRDIKGRYGRPSQRILVQSGWDSYLGNEDQLKQWRTNQYYKYKNEHVNQKLGIQIEHSASMAIDLYLYILAKAKQTTIDNFIGHFGNAIKLYETYESSLMKEIKNKEIQLKRVLTEEEKIQIYKSVNNNEVKSILKYNLLENVSKKRNKKNQLQQFFTNDNLATYIYKYSSLTNDKNNNIKILEPTAGQGSLIKPIIQCNKNIHVTMVEIDPENRIELQKMINEHKTILSLAEQNNFLVYTPSDRFNYVFMNPPFHLRREDDRNLIKDVYDYDFIKKAFSLLKIGGELMAITGNFWKKNDDFIKWTKLDDKIFEHEEKKNEKFSGIKIDITVMKITKKNSINDNDILKIKYYKTQTDEGSLVVNNTMDINDIFNHKKTVSEVKQELLPFEKEIDELNNILKFAKK